MTDAHIGAKIDGYAKQFLGDGPRIVKPGEEPTGAERRSIKTNNRQLCESSDEALAALQTANEPPVLFQRDAYMVRIDDKIFQGRSGTEVRRVIARVELPELRHHLSRVVGFHKTVHHPGGGLKDVFCSPPLDIVADLLARPTNQWKLPPLQSVIECPAFRQDGTILEQQGYDPATAYYFANTNGLNMPPVTPSPTEDEIDTAKAWIDDILVDFPFTDTSSKANAIAALMTPVCRPAILGPTPMGLITATTAGTGKTLLCEVIALTVTGSASGLVTLPKDDEELDKKITAILLESTQIVVFDNIGRKLQSDGLCKTITADKHSERILGKSEQVELPVLCSWFATGNNIQVGGDMPRRCYWVPLDAKMSNPQSRTGFTHPDLKTYVRDHRGMLLWALLTLARAWFAAGCPKPSITPLGSFENWSRVVGGILEHAGIRGFLENTADQSGQADIEAGQWESWLLALSERFGADAFRAADIVSAMDERLHTSSNELSTIALAIVETIPDNLAVYRDKKGGVQRSIGNSFARFRGRRFGDSGVYVERAGTYQGAARWRIIRSE